MSRRIDPDSLYQRLRAYCLDLVAQGGYPSKTLLEARFPDEHWPTLSVYRSVALAGVVAPVARPRSRPDGFGEDESDQEAIEEAAAEIRAAKAKREEPWSMTVRMPRVFSCRLKS